MLFKKTRPERLGLIAGQGNFPLLIAEGAKRQGVEVIAFAAKGFASEQIEQIAAKTHWLQVGELQQAIDLFHEENLKHAVMAGRIPHTVVFKIHTLDKRARGILFGMKEKKADSLLGRAVEEFANEGIEFIDSSTYVSDLIPQKGVLTPSRKPSEEEMADVHFGLDLAKSIAGLDIGQTIVVKSGVVVAVEAIEGTDRTIKRSGEVAGEGTVVVKVSKPRQDKRFDIPVIGITTIRHMVEAKATCLAISARETLFFDQEEAIPLAESHGISIIAV